MRTPLWLLLILAANLLVGCGSNTPPGSGGPADIPFDLFVPTDFPSADYTAVSGMAIVNESQLIGDTLIDLSGRSFYAQFRARTGVELPARAQLNGNDLERHLGGDTLRLSSAKNGSDVYGTNVWTLIAADSSQGKFSIAPMAALDTIAPISRNPIVRGDASLELTWRPPATASAGMRIIWTAPNSSTVLFKQDVSDFAGKAVIPASEMQKLAGDRRVIFLRYRSDSYTFNGKSVIVMRLAQRSYSITVQP